MHIARRLISTAALGLAGALACAWAGSGTITASPNPCRIMPGLHKCTTFVSWTTQNAPNARVYVKAVGKGGTPEKQFSSKANCEKCDASWIEAGDQYVFSLVDFSAGTRGAILGTVIVTAMAEGEPAGAGSGAISATPNPCRIEPGKAVCTTYVTWATHNVEHARVYITMEGKASAPEKEWSNAKVCDKCSASWIGAGSRYIFTLYDFTSGSRGRALGSVVVTAVK